MGPWGANYLVDRDPKLRGDAVIIGEPSSPQTIRFGERGFVWIKVITRGQSSHSAYPNHGWNAINAMTRILTELRGLETRPWPIPDDFIRTIDAARQTTDALLAAVPRTAVVRDVNPASSGEDEDHLTADYCERK